MAPEDAAKPIEESFARYATSAIRFPAHWFGGRPYETRVRLTDARAAARRLVLEFDASQLLVVASLDVTCTCEVLTISGFHHYVLETTAYDDGSVGVLVGDAGVIHEFHGGYGMNPNFPQTASRN